MKKIILICIAAITFCGLQAQNNWEKIELPDSVNFSQVYCLDENIVFAFAGKFFGGSNTLYKSSDGGKSWKVVLIDIHPKQGSKKMFPAKMSFINQNIGYLVMDCQFYKTTDAGENWSCLGFSPWGQTSLGRLLAIDEDNIWLLSDYGDLMISNDGGKTFHFNMIFNN